LVNEREVGAGLAPTPSYRYADRIGDRLVVAGQVPLDRDGAIVAIGDIRRQARQCLDNLVLLLTVHDFDQRDIHHLRIYVVGERRLLTEAWTAIVEWFDGDVPPATLLGVSCLGYGEQLVEIDAEVMRSS
jgi:enamine deaminase RidA (YjgF/YER057c/UK114 family)